MKETSKSVLRRVHDVRFATRYLIGAGIDIGCGTDPISLYSELFPLMKSLRRWDVADGDAQFMTGLEDNSFDFVHSSHCLEHLNDPEEGLRNWLRILKPGGHMIVLVPDEDLYEQGRWPSTKNRDHKSTFTITKPKSWSGGSRNVFDLLRDLGEQAEVVKVELLDGTYRYRLPAFDQTATPVGECAIEFIVRKREKAEVTAGGRIPPAGQLNRTEIFYLTGQDLAKPAAAAAPAAASAAAAPAPAPAADAPAKPAPAAAEAAETAKKSRKKS